MSLHYKSPLGLYRPKVCFLCSLLFKTHFFIDGDYAQAKRDYKLQSNLLLSSPYFNSLLISC